MARNFALSCLLTALVAGCGEFVSFCEGPEVKSPDGRCSASLVQDIATHRAYAVLECRAWHVAPFPDWNAVVAKGPRTPMGIRWLTDRVLEVAVNDDATIERLQPPIGGPSYEVEVLLKKMPKSVSIIEGSGLGALGDLSPF